MTDTIKSEELFTLSAIDALWHLYHEEEVTLYDPQDVEFKCSCSRERCADVLKTLLDEEIDSIIAEEGKIDMHCDYCGSHYLFTAMNIAEIRNNASPAAPSCIKISAFQAPPNCGAFFTRLIALQIVLHESITKTNFKVKRLHSQYSSFLYQNSAN